MSASIYYQAVKGKNLSVGAKSSFLAAIERAFGGVPCVLSEHDVLKLQGLAAAFDSEDQRAAVQELIEAIEKHASVRVWAEY